MLADLYRMLDASLRGRPDRWLTVALLLTGVVTIAVALAGPRLLKAGLLAWEWLP